jgi:hypothetical protein
MAALLALEWTVSALAVASARWAPLLAVYRQISALSCFD